MSTRFSTDQAVALLLAPFVLALIGLLYLVVVPLQGRPFLFAAERMRTRDEAFLLLKIRTMHPPRPSDEQSPLGGYQVNRITPVGAILRKLRLDELPQIINVLRGDIRFIGPRPPLRKYVEAYPEIYDEILRDTPPGITGLATVLVHNREERLLLACRSEAETDEVYRRRCIPVKARLDRLYRDRRGLGLKLFVLWRTVSRLSAARPEPGAAKRPGLPHADARRGDLHSHPDYAFAEI